MIYKNTTVFDFETTGLRPETANVLEIGSLRIRNGKETGIYSELLNPMQDIPALITELTGIGVSDVFGCTICVKGLIRLVSIIEGSLLVGYNVAFDLAFLNHFTAQHYGRNITNPFLDVRGMAIHAWPYKSHKLAECCAYAGIELSNAHRALGDVTATWELAKHLWDNWDEYRSKNSEAQPREWYINKVLHYRKYKKDLPFVPEHGKLHLVG